MNNQASYRRMAVDPGCYAFIGANHLGKAVFAARAFHKGAVIARFGGASLSGSRVPHNQSGAKDRYMQIDDDRFLGPSGGLDDFVNHSCAPNTGVRFTAYGIVLLVLREIAKGEEIAWDYSTTMHNNSWVMRCDCRASACRGLVREFDALPADRQAYYLAEGVVAPYISRARAVQALAGASPVLPPAASSAPLQDGLAHLHRRVHKFADDLARKHSGGAFAAAMRMAR
jgi:hypothetical protein